jgi:hypothetical protein
MFLKVIQKVSILSKFVLIHHINHDHLADIGFPNDSSLKKEDISIIFKNWNNILMNSNCQVFSCSKSVIVNLLYQWKNIFQILLLFRRHHYRVSYCLAEMYLVSLRVKQFELLYPLEFRVPFCLYYLKKRKITLYKILLTK